MKKTILLVLIISFGLNHSYSQVVLNQGILTNYNLNWPGGGGCDAGCNTYSDIGAPWHNYIINTTGTATVNAANGNGILCNATQTGNASANTATATYTLTSNCTYTCTSQFGFCCGSCPDSRADGGDNLSITQAGGTILSQGADIAPGTCGPTHNATASATGCGNAVLTCTMVIQTGASIATVNFNYTSNRSDEVSIFQITSNLATCGVIVLPIQLLDFSAVKDFSSTTSSINVSWTTAREVNNNYFMLEYSLDGLTFMPYKEIKAVGNSNINRNYSCNFTEEIGNTNPYFRLKQVDNNGSFAYSAVITIGSVLVSSKMQSDVTVFYNEAGNIVTQFSLNAPSLLSFSLYDLAGAEVYACKNQLNEGIQEFAFTAPDVSGVYILVFQNGSSAPVRKKVMVAR